MRLRTRHHGRGPDPKDGRALSPPHGSIILDCERARWLHPDPGQHLRDIEISVDALESRLHRARVNLREHVLRRVGGA
jgi:hypothetical protein